MEGTRAARGARVALAAGRGVGSAEARAAAARATVKQAGAARATVKQATDKKLAGGLVSCVAAIVVKRLSIAFAATYPLSNVELIWAPLSA
jgi:hypothetical protein